MIDDVNRWISFSAILELLLISLLQSNLLVNH